MFPRFPSGPEGDAMTGLERESVGCAEKPEVIVRAMNRSMCVTADGEPNQDRLLQKTCQQHPWTPF